MADESKKLLKDSLFLRKLNDNGIATSFYNKRQKCGKKIGLGPNF